jgi:hypothetical protein
MQALRFAPRPVGLFCLGVLTLLVLGFALYTKGDVRAAVKMFGVEMSLDAKDRPSHKP